jgi:hypothetical protein
MFSLPLHSFQSNGVPLFPEMANKGLGELKKGDSYGRIRVLLGNIRVNFE